MWILAFKVTKFLKDVDPKFDLTSADGDSCPAWMKMDYSWEPITPTNLSSSSPERREADTGRERDRNKWFVSTMTMMMEERGEEITESSLACIHPHLSQSLHIQSPLADVHSQTPEGKKVSQRPWGPITGQSSPQSLYTHTHIYTHYSHLHSTCPLDLTIKTQEQIFWLVTAAQKQMMPNTWLLYGLYCRAAWEGCSRWIWHSTCPNIFQYWKCGSQQSTWVWRREICLSCCVEFTGYRWRFNNSYQNNVCFIRVDGFIETLRRRVSSEKIRQNS